MQSSASSLMQRHAIVASLLVLYILSWMNVFYPVLRFSSQVANYSAFAIGQLIPVWVTRLSRSWSGWQRRVLVTIAALLMLPAFPSGIAATGCAAMSVWGNDWLDRLRVVPIPAGTISLYRTNGGATSPFGIVVRQECRIAPGIVVVRQLAHEVGDQADVEWAGRGSVRVIFRHGGIDRQRDNVRIYPLRRFCWGDRLTAAAADERRGRDALP